VSKRKRWPDMPSDGHYCSKCWHGPRPNERAAVCERKLLDRGWRPFPNGHSLPSALPYEVHCTRIEYEGEPRKRKHRHPTEQHWFPGYVDAIQKAFAGTGCGMLSDEAVEVRRTSSNTFEALKPITAEQWLRFEARGVRDALLLEAAANDAFRSAVLAALRLGGIPAVRALLHSSPCEAASGLKRSGI
jgi:hypothetical protein